LARARIVAQEILAFFTLFLRIPSTSELKGCNYAGLIQLGDLLLGVSRSKCKSFTPKYWDSNEKWSDFEFLNVVNSCNPNSRPIFSKVNNIVIGKFRNCLILHPPLIGGMRATSSELRRTMEESRGTYCMLRLKRRLF
jgi:hypothetical protein